MTSEKICLLHDFHDQYLLEAIWVQISISSREMWRQCGAPPRKGRQIRRLPETSGWVFIVRQTVSLHFTPINVILKRKKCSLFCSSRSFLLNNI